MSNEKQKHIANATTSGQRNESVRKIYRCRTSFVGQVFLVLEMMKMTPARQN